MFFWYINDKTVYIYFGGCIPFLSIPIYVRIFVIFKRHNFHVKMQTSTSQFPLDSPNSKSHVHDMY